MTKFAPIAMAMSLSLGLVAAHVSAEPDTNRKSGFSMEIETEQSASQARFDAAMERFWEEDCANAVRLFAEAAEIDPNCAMCAWGEALALGPRVGLPMNPADQALALEKALMARELAQTPFELAMTGSMVHRYQAPGGWKVFARDMKMLAGQYTDHVALQLIAAEALMIVAEMSYDGAAAQSDAAAIAILLKRASVLEPGHPALERLKGKAAELSRSQS